MTAIGDTHAQREITVASIPDEELLRRAICGARPSRKSHRWVVVSDVFGLGSTFSWQLCRRFNLDPEEEVKAWPR